MADVSAVGSSLVAAAAGGDDSTLVSFGVGDTVASLAQEHGVSLEDLMAANPDVLHPKLVRTGQVLHMPTPSTASAGGPAHASPGPAATDQAHGGLALTPGNAPYALFIMEANARTGEAPAAVAATVGAEATTRHGAWDPNSTASGSSGVGLTQFTDKTWLGVANEPGTALNEAVRAKGLIDPTTGKVAASKRSEVLALRTDLRLSILAAADYSKDNLNALRASGAIPQTLSPGLTAKAAYLAHHEGLAGAKAYLHNTATSSKTSTPAQTAMKNLSAQGLGAKREAQLLAASGGDPVKAYHSFLTTYIDEKIQVGAYTPGGADPADDASIDTLMRK